LVQKGRTGQAIEYFSSGDSRGYAPFRSTSSGRTQDFEWKAWDGRMEVDLCYRCRHLHPDRLLRFVRLVSGSISSVWVIHRTYRVFPPRTKCSVFIPDLPTKIKPNWIFNADDIALGNQRMQLAGRAGPQAGAFNFRFFRKLLTEWHIWLFTITYSLYIFAQSKLDA
jgi:hypothetical protein